MEMNDKEKIIEYFKEKGLPKPVTIKLVGYWAYGVQYAVTCGIFRLKKYAVYFSDGRITSVRFRG